MGPATRISTGTATRCSRFGLTVWFPLVAVALAVSEVMTPAVWSPGDALIGTRSEIGTMTVERAGTVTVEALPGIWSVIQVPASVAATSLACIFNAPLGA